MSLDTEKVAFDSTKFFAWAVLYTRMGTIEFPKFNTHKEAIAFARAKVKETNVDEDRIYIYKLDGTVKKHPATTLYTDFQYSV